MADDHILFAAKVMRAGANARTLRGMARQVDREIREEMEFLKEEAETTYKEFAPFGDNVYSGRLHDKIRASTRRVGRSLELVVAADASEAGFNYVGVSRFGHRANRSYIYPADRKRGALRLRFADGTVAYRKRVLAYHPAEDWAAEPAQHMDTFAADATRRLGKRVSTSHR